ncbi:MAG: dTDP-4-dehydrorhamnose 3,5-epimerase family protein, partial [Steroidobacteraceae bacterium]
VTGTVFDVVVDIRRSSATFGQWVGVTLSGENHHMLWVPPGFAHGYLVLSESADFLYKVTDFWAAQHERAIRWDDPEVGVRWPLPAGAQPVLSEKDRAAVPLREAEIYP